MRCDAQVDSEQGFWMRAKYCGLGHLWWSTGLGLSLGVRLGWSLRGPSFRPEQSFHETPPLTPAGREAGSDWSGSLGGSGYEPLGYVGHDVWAGVVGLGGTARR